MRHHWLEYRVKQKQINLNYKPATKNWANYFTKHWPQNITSVCDTNTFKKYKFRTRERPQINGKDMPRKKTSKKPLTIVRAPF